MSDLHDPDDERVLGTTQKCWGSADPYQLLEDIAKLRATDANVQQQVTSLLVRIERLEKLISDLGITRR